ncbi:Cell Wall Hydrolase [Sphingomonas laterariae]|uniref:Cell Wall Hydrolase n=1 Tax=Edaphosphingomonas laterariae TaxID=861865 RepID=A0A239DXP7_9SPHN|nr:cell wall hydrolase [Sphingomonas laterariae]SNS37107.1 Cell Wall Hydrolase [Sphingomonas laterariae]
MSLRLNRRNLAVSAAVALATAVPATFGFASETSLAATISAAFPADTANLADAPAVADAAVETASATIVAEGPGEAVEAPVLPLKTPAVAVAAADPIDEAELDCMAKVVHHEAGNQSRDGQLAVAQLIMNRLESGRFADSVCAVVNQRGQFFNTHAYNPKRTTAMWQSAVDVSREAMVGTTADVVPGALFYHATYIAPPRFFRTRQRAGVLGDHIFYR